ncbi:hypothetical protein EVAR_4468_1 [Eumeta japonica]|uniref:Uncharacterized protein n=1 Tax=Eumeta variegata TaxID=151549 RepID=A0A4C1SXW9_EUMVA|nr:hypothetical protein EVAR_4468_1 [Eumeta japonica]
MSADHGCRGIWSPRVREHVVICTYLGVSVCQLGGPHSGRVLDFSYDSNVVPITALLSTPISRSMVRGEGEGGRTGGRHAPVREPRARAYLVTAAPTLMHLMYAVL